MKSKLSLQLFEISPIGDDDLPELWIPALIGALVATASTPPLLSILYRWNVIDVATSRSSHSGTAVRGVGIATLAGVTAGLLVALCLAGPELEGLLLITLGSSFFGAVLGAVEDFRGLSVGTRASIQLVIAVVTSLGIVMETEAPWLLGIPATVFIAGYINAANFVDGLNGMSGVHGLVSGVFYLYVGSMLDMPWMMVSGGVIATTFTAFLPWNLGRKGTFLGDSGSYLLGGLVSSVAVATWLSGVELLVAFAPTIIYTLDAGFTTIRRVKQGEKWYEAHRDFIYQRISTAGLSHPASSSIVGLFAAVVSGISLWVFYGSSFPLTVGYILVLFVCVLYCFMPHIVRVLRKEQQEIKEKLPTPLER